MGILKIIYEDISMTAKEDSILSSNGAQSFTDVSRIKTGTNELIKYASLEYGRWKLDGTFKNLPNALNAPISGVFYWSNKLSNKDNIFENKPILTIDFDDFETSVGFVITFDALTDDYVTDMTVQWFQNNTLLSEKNVKPNKVEYFVHNYIQNFNKIVITCHATSKPYRYAKISNIVYGITRTFTNSDISDISLIQEVDLTSSTISINTVDFTLQNLDGRIFSFQKRQPLKLFFKEKLVGIYYITKATQLSDVTFEIETEDLIGALDKYTFMGGIFENASVPQVLSAIFGNNIPYELDASFANSTITGYIPICTCREALTFIAFSIGAVVTTANSDKVNIKPLNAQTIDFSYDENKVFFGNSFENNDKVTGIEVTGYNYNINSNAVAETLYKGSENSAFIRFNAPMHSLTCTGGTIKSSNCNYATIELDSGSTEMILSGKRYDVSETIKSKLDPIISANDFENQMSFAQCYLVNSTNIESIMNRLYDFYVTQKNNNSSVTLDVTDGGEIADRIEFETEFLGVKKGYITELRFNPLGSKIFADAKIKMLEV